MPDGEMVSAKPTLDKVDVSVQIGLPPDIKEQLKNFTESAKAETANAASPIEAEILAAAKEAADKVLAQATQTLSAASVDTSVDLDAKSPTAPEIKTEPVEVLKSESVSADKSSEAPKRMRFSEPDPDLEPIDLITAATTMLKDCKPHWIPGLRAKANSMGMRKERASRVEWRRVFMAWGGPDALT